MGAPHPTCFARHLPLEGKALVRSTLYRYKLGGRPMVAPTNWTIFTSAKLVITARPLRGRTSSTADAVPLPLKVKALLRIKILCQHNNKGSVN